MASAFSKRAPVLLYRHVVFLCLVPVALQSCKGNKLIYNSKCDDGITFKKVEFSKLIKHIQDYDQQYVEVSGTYMESKEQSALYNDSLFTDHSNKHALWINFSQDCPLYLKGTRTGLFEPTNGEFILVNKKKDQNSRQNRFA